MSAIRIDGKAVADTLLAEVGQDVAGLRQQGVHPALAVILVGDDPASDVYVRNKVQRAEAVGIRSLEYRLPANTSEAALLERVQALNGDASVHGILVQMPLPAHISEASVIQAIAPHKDVDGFHRENVGSLSLGQESLVPCTPAGCMRLLRTVLGEDGLKGLHAVVVGRSNIVGKPMAALLLQADCSVTVVHSRSRDAAALCRQADIMVAAVGRPAMIGADWVKPGAIVIDVGINRIATPEGKTRLIGDVDYPAVAPLAHAITPVPGGVGPMTIAGLLANTVKAARQQTGH
ncbi:methylenetetrahydrofolate dehydrogenase (NADP+) / methenyltetrahydrofolate cyclohydrolase [Lampropedia hyalina DSM 16112]|jgi:methylenetetrahydrofolate dehydrogenase (NADP+)/methenyltetrahydrofolate cyclohydrolase|uniref:Bifunctional protein FolD n=1 Tax=Lampropedia hyalina DSM 16112 TaxID=1122156 RepID=A0A1M4T7C9_9BURK|nr:bifunctional methylenetetrahydrofolate dehydrogenase/methenyltetrahydrofolate cyclohydrolase FolD [Lampropedia hyalina]SHE40248.1 methylenetetrahydrofolate dehydrogenase (NADP+) / methenyltetrahydrofolate cyclohydrolase [Lampropedia hyalina DSM 16112]